MYQTVGAAVRASGPAWDACPHGEIDVPWKATIEAGGFAQSQAYDVLDLGARVGGRPARRLDSAHQPTRLVSQQILEGLWVEVLVGPDPLLPMVLVLALLEPSSLGDVHPARTWAATGITSVGLTPWGLQISWAEAPASPYRRIEMICPSVNRLLRMTPPSLGSQTILGSGSWRHVTLYTIHLLDG